MKKYWRTLLALIVIVASIGTYYVSSVIEAKSYPTFHIQTLEGDVSLLNPISIVAYYEDDSKEGVIQMAHDTMRYRDHQSFFEQFKGLPYTYDRRLRDEYTSIFRRAAYLGNNVFENDQYIALATLIRVPYERYYASMEVNVFVKETNKMETITIDLDEQDLWIQDIQMKDDEVIVFTSAWIDHGGQGLQESFQNYHFNISTGQHHVDSSAIFTHESEPGVTISKLGESPHWKASEFVVFRKETEDKAARQQKQGSENNNEAAAEPLLGNELIVYEVETGKTEVLLLPERFQSKEVNWYDGSNLYFADFQSDAVHMTVFNIRAENIASEFSIPNDAGEGQSPLVTVYDGYVYALDTYTNQAHHAKLVVIDAETGEYVYRGEIVPNDDEQMEDSSVLHFSTLYFRS